jgi:deoxyribodipyrimidine photo-lyase
VKLGHPIVPVYILSDDEQWALGGASRWWLHHSLISLENNLQELGSKLILLEGDPAVVLKKLIRATGASHVYWNRCYEPLVIQRDTTLKASLLKDNIEAKSFNSALLFEPWEIKTGEGKPYQVFTPFWRTCRSLPPPRAPLPSPEKLKSPSTWPLSKTLTDFHLLPKVEWDKGFKSAWKPGEAGAHNSLKHLLKTRIGDYATARNYPAQSGTSRLSPHLHFGEISPRQIWQEVERNSKKLSFSQKKSADVFLTEIGWREFAYHLLYHFPHTPEQSLRASFRTFPWQSDNIKLRAWQKGQTGYPIVDAGLRELWVTGWMHNRVRMIAASFLVKDLLISWQEGARWFWDTLVDADLASNTLGWQWSAGCGADAAPYFRIFNPVSQGEKFDPDGNYVRTWVPEISALPNKWIHQPWVAPREILEEARVVLGKTYPAPLVSHAEVRERALLAFKKTKVH